MRAELINWEEVIELFKRNIKRANELDDVKHDNIKPVENHIAFMRSDLSALLNTLNNIE